MASSLIHINEATAEQLQAIPGIGPVRAAHVIRYRKQVAPISSVYDLAAATGLSISAANNLAPLIDWSSRASNNIYKPLAFLWVVTAILVIRVITTTTFELIQQLHEGASLAVYFHLGVLFVLIGSFIAITDIAITALRGSRSRNPTILILAVTISLCGFAAITLLAVYGSGSAVPADFALRVTATFNFVGYGITIALLMLSPTFLTRLTFNDQFTRFLPGWMNIYDHCQYLIGFPVMLVLVFHNSTFWLEEIFSVWIVVLLSMNSLALLTGKSASVGMLSDIDQGRARFISQRNSKIQWFTSESRQPIGVASVVMTIAVLVASAWAISQTLHTGLN